jgi:hypothetical protein
VKQNAQTVGIWNPLPLFGDVVWDIGTRRAIDLVRIFPVPLVRKRRLGITVQHRLSLW